MIVGGLTWGLMFYCIFRFRRRKDDVGLPPQLRYNVPIEALYTVLPIMMVLVIFYFTERDQSALLDTKRPADVHVNVIGKQWSWDFNYVEGKVYDTGQQAQLNGKPGAQAALPTLYLPVNKRIEFDLTARDVIHSFWVPAFLEKMDVNPGIVNRFQVTPTQEGTFQGKCAELCGAYHSQMLFNVKIVDKAEYEAHIQKLKEQGDTGLLKNGLNRDEINKRDTHLLPEGVRN